MSGIPQPILPRFEAAYIPEPNSGCWLWIRSLNSKGYGRISWYNRRWLAHKVSYELHRGPIPLGLCVLHTCDMPSCVNPQHLFLGTLSDNMQDCSAKRRSGAWRKLTPAQVLEIRASNERQHVLAARYGVNRSTISEVRAGKKSWKYLPGAKP